MTPSPPLSRTWRLLLSESPDLDGKLRWWLSSTLNCSLTQIPLDSAPDDALQARFLEARHRLRQNEPVQYICGKAPFMDFEVTVTPDVLIPRPETEQLVQRILEETPRTPLDVLDVGTGSGCIALALKRARPGWRVTGIDVSEKALQVARKNREALAPAAEIQQGNLLAGCSPRSADLIVANLPYIGEAERESLPAEVRDYEPGLALFADDQGTALVFRLVQQAWSVLRPGGSLYLETGEHQTAVYHRLAEALGLRIESFRDFAGRERFHRIRI